MKQTFLFVIAQFARLILLLFAAAICLTMCSCRTTRTDTQVVVQSVHDTLYLNKLQYDSIFIQNDHSQEFRSDTVLVNNRTIEYRYKLLRDTVHLTKTDSIPVIKEVEVTKEVKYIPTLYKWGLNLSGTFVLLLIIVLIIKRFLK